MTPQVAVTSPNGADHSQPTYDEGLDIFNKPRENGPQHRDRGAPVAFPTTSPGSGVSEAETNGALTPTTPRTR